MLAYRIKFKGIVSEAYIPEKHNGITIIFLPGLPSYLSKNDLTFAVANSRCAVFHPHYSGSFDSAGNFSPEQCLKDVKTFIQMARQGELQELYFDKKFKLNTKTIVLLGTSFGSSIAALSCREPQVGRIVLLSPVVTYDQKLIEKYVSGFDFNNQMSGLIKLIQKTFPYSYRIRDWGKLKDFLFAKNPERDPIVFLGKNLAKPLLVVHGLKDTSTPHTLTNKLLSGFLRGKDYKAIFPKKVGHSLRTYDKPTIAKIVKFINGKPF